MSDTPSSPLLEHVPLETQFLVKCATAFVHGLPTEGFPEGVTNSRLDWQKLFDTSTRQGMLAVVRHVLEESECLVHVPEPSRRVLARKSEAARLAVELVSQKLVEILDAFGSEAVDVMPFKGPVLATVAYGSEFLRKPGDIDLLVRQQDVYAAVRVLDVVGYSPRISPDQLESHFRRRGSVTLDGVLPDVDLHVTLNQRVFDSLPFSWHFDMDSVWDRRREVQFRGRRTATLGAEDAVAFLFLHGAKDLWGSMFQVCDVARLLAHDKRIDWDWLLADARRSGGERFLLLGLSATTQLFDVSLPEPVRRRLQAESYIAAMAKDLLEGMLLRRVPARAADFTGYHLTRARMLQGIHKQVAYLILRLSRKLSKLGGLD